MVVSNESSGTIGKIRQQEKKKKSLLKRISQLPEGEIKDGLKTGLEKAWKAGQDLIVIETLIELYCDLLNQRKQLLQNNNGKK
jgi:hypothetical protein